MSLIDDNRRYRPTPMAPPVVQCRICGSVPAADVTFRQHTGILVLMQIGRIIDGNYQSADYLSLP